MRRPGAVTLALTLFAVCTAAAPGVFFSAFSTPKLMALAIGAVAAIGMTWRAGGVPAGLRDGEGRVLLLMATAALAWLILTTALADDPMLALVGTRERRLGAPAIAAAIALFTAGAAVLRAAPEGRVLVLRGASAAALVCGGLTVIQRVLGQVPAASTFSNADVSSAVACGLFWLAAGGVRFDGNAVARFLHIAGCAAAAVCVAASGSWAGAAGLAAGFAVVLWSGERGLRVVGLGGLCLGAAAAAVLTSGGPDVQPVLWRDSVLAVLRVPVFGAGPENFAPAFAAAALGQAGLAASPSNFVLDFVVAGGFAAAGLMLWTVRRTVAWGRVGLSAGDGLCGYLLGALAAVLCAHLFVSLSIAAVLVVSCAAAGLFAAVPLLSEAADAAAHAEQELVRRRVRRGEEHRRRRPRRELSSSLRAMGRARVKPALAAVWIGGAVSLLAVLPVASADFQSAGLLRGNVEQRRAVYSRMRNGMLSPLVPHFWYSRQAATAGRYDEAWSAGVAAAAYPGEDLPAVAYHLATIASRRQDWKRATNLARQSVRFAPVWYEPRVLLAHLAWREGRVAEAREQARQAVRLAAGASAEVRASIAALARSFD